MNTDILALTDDLTPNQFQALLHWLWVNSYTPKPINIRFWRATVAKI